MTGSSSFSLPHETCQVGCHTNSHYDGKVRVSWARKSNIFGVEVSHRFSFIKHTQSLIYRTVTFCLQNRSSKKMSRAVSALEAWGHYYSLNCPCFSTRISQSLQAVKMASVQSRERNAFNDLLIAFHEQNHFRKDTPSCHPALRGSNLRRMDLGSRETVFPRLSSPTCWRRDRLHHPHLRRDRSPSLKPLCMFHGTSYLLNQIIHSLMCFASR